ncbi:MAG: methylenetetrahydrofolate reductase [NAD(P)H] [Opitutales bacterium]
MNSRPIIERLAEPGPALSIEFFPPKDALGEEAFLRTVAETQAAFRPDFVSITYGAGGSTRERTLHYADLLKDECGLNVMPHLTCVGSSRAEILEIVRDYDARGFRNLMALRGDPPKGAARFEPHPDGLAYAADLVALLHEAFPRLCLGVAGYPEVHPEAASPRDDLGHLKRKVEAGAAFITTQLFYRTDNFLRFVEQCRDAGITVPILPGLMPVLSASAARRFCNDVPAELGALLDEAGEDRERVREIGLDWAYRQICELLEAGVVGIHLYLLNRTAIARPLIERLKDARLV